MPACGLIAVALIRLMVSPAIWQSG